METENVYVVLPSPEMVNYQKVDHQKVNVPKSQQYFMFILCSEAVFLVVCDPSINKLWAT
jgi:hypothetical protein